MPKHDQTRRQKIIQQINTKSIDRTVELNGREFSIPTINSLNEHFRYKYNRNHQTVWKYFKYSFPAINITNEMIRKYDSEIRDCCNSGGCFKCIHAHCDSLIQRCAIFMLRRLNEKLPYFQRSFLHMHGLCGDCVNELLLCIDLKHFIQFSYKHLNLSLPLLDMNGYFICQSLLLNSKIFKVITQSSFEGIKLFWNVWNLNLYQLCLLYLQNTDKTIFNDPQLFHHLTTHSLLFSKYLLRSIQRLNLEQLHYFIVEHYPTLSAFFCQIIIPKYHNMTIPWTEESDCLLPKSCMKLISTIYNFGWSDYVMLIKDMQRDIVCMLIDIATAIFTRLIMLYCRHKKIKFQFRYQIKYNKHKILNYPKEITNEVLKSFLIEKLNVEIQNVEWIIWNSFLNGLIDHQNGMELFVDEQNRYKALKKTKPCNNCTRTDRTKIFKICSNCKLCCYCSKKCQKVHWKDIHRYQCQILASNINV